VAVRVLKAPDPQFGNLPLKVLSIPAKKLFRISSHLSGEPYFGRSASHRFDDPRSQYGTCYLGFKIDTAVAESILHDLEPVRGGYEIAAEKAASTYIHRFNGADLRVADLTGHHLNVLGGHAELFGTSSYAIPMLWSRAVFDHPAKVDGFVYMSRLLTTQKALVLFERGTSLDIQKDSSTVLTKSKPFARVRRDLNIRYG
jgi:hypothetical protein